MSWDVMVFKFLGGPPHGADSIKEENLRALGPAEDVRQGISALLPGVDWSSPTWGLFDGDGFSIEFNVGSKNLIDNMMLHVRGGGNAIATILSFANPLGWSLFDCSTGEFLDPEQPSQSGWVGFQKYRDKCLQRDHDKPNL